MKVQNITDIDKFFEVVDRCSGKVELVTGEGDRLNFPNSEIPELEIVAYEPDDIERLTEFMLKGE